VTVGVLVTTLYELDSAISTISTNYK